MSVDIVRVAVNFELDRRPVILLRGIAADPPVAAAGVTVDSVLKSTASPRATCGVHTSQRRPLVFLVITFPCIVLAWVFISAMRPDHAQSAWAARSGARWACRGGQAAGR